MTSTMKNWITPTVEDEFSMAYDSIQPEYTPGRPLEKYPYVCTKETLTVHLTRGRHVQLIEILDFSQPLSDFEVVLSDGTTKLRASFTPPATAEFDTMREFSNRSLGAILGISDYFLTYNLNSPKAERLALRVVKFKVLGCQGENPFGRPIDIEQQESLWDILSKLDDFLSKPTQKRDEELDIQSQAGDVEDREISPVALNSQVAFLTQVPGKALVPNAPSFSKDATILPLLEKPTVASRTSVNAQTLLRPVSDQRRIEMSSRLDSKANSQPLLSSSGSNGYELSPKETSLPLSSRSIPDEDSEKENSQETSNMEKVQVFALPVKENQPVTEVQTQDTSELFVARMRERNPFEGMKRVPRSYFRIPENQQAMLDSKNSWYRPEVDSQSSHASIPPDVLRELISHADQSQPHRKFHHEEESEVETKEATSKVDEGSDVEEANFNEEDISGEDIASQSKDSEKHNDLTSDEGSVLSFSSDSHHGNVELDKEATQVYSSLQASNIDFVESANINIASRTPNLHLEHNSSPPSPLISGISLPPNLVPKIDYSFPPSSPGDEQELEIAVPYAIDDEIVDGEESSEEPETSQELPSTAVQKNTAIQVEQTPDHNQRQIHELIKGKRSDPQLHPLYFDGSREVSEYVSSDHFIPATLHDPSSQDRLPISKKWFPATSDKHVRSALSSAENQLYTLQGVRTTEEHDVINEESEVAEAQILTQLKVTQREHSQPDNSSPVRHLSTTPETLRSPTSMTLGRNEISRNLPPLRATSQHPISFHASLPDITSDNEKPSVNDESPPNQVSLTRGDERTQLEARKFKNRSMRQSLKAAASQAETLAKDTIAMARMNRHMFHAKCSSSLEDSPVVQIAQSQSQSVISKQPFPAQPFADGNSQQSSTGLVLSSVSEGTEKALTVKHESEVDPATNTKSSLRTKITKTRSDSGSPKLSQPGSFADGDDLDMASVLSPFQSKESDMRRVSTRRIMEVEDEMKILSTSSDFEEEKQAQDDESTEDLELPNQNVQQRYTMGSNRENYSSSQRGNEATMGEYELASEDKLPEEAQQEKKKQPAYHIESPRKSRERHQSPEFTAYKRFKLIYPSYSGEEKSFIWALVYIEWLVENKGENFLRASLWDDFVRTLAAEFLEYLRASRIGNIPRKKVKTGFAYFNYLDKNPIFQNRVITPNSLTDCLLTLDFEAVQETRSIFSQSASSLTDHPKPQTSHRPPSISSKNSQFIQTKMRNVPNSAVEITDPSESHVIREPWKPKGSGRATLKRPFFETPSQLQAAKRPHTASTRDEEADVDALRTSESCRSRVWRQNILPQPSDTPSPVSGDRLTISAPAFSSRIHATSTNPKEKRGATSSTSFEGSPASPILGEPELTSRSFSAMDIHAGSIGLPLLKEFKKPSTPVSKAALQRRSNSALSDEKSKVEGWLEQRHSPLNPDELLRQDCIKRKQESCLQLLDMPSSTSTTATFLSATRPKAIIDGSAGPVPSSSGSGKSMDRQKTSFQDFLKLRRARSLSSSTPRSASAAKRKYGHLEPETQVWGP